MIGGHKGVTHEDPGSLLFLRGIFGNTMLDLGCGPGGQVLQAAKMGFEDVRGVDGDGDYKRPEREDGKKIWVIHDFTSGPLSLDTNYAFCWSNEFLEHVPQSAIPNFMPVVQRCNGFAGTYHPPGSTPDPHHQHYNEQDLDYWIDVFWKYGFTYDKEASELLKLSSSMRKNFVRKYGMVFHNDKVSL